MFVELLKEAAQYLGPLLAPAIASTATAFAAWIIRHFERGKLVRRYEKNGLGHSSDAQ